MSATKRGSEKSARDHIRGLRIVGGWYLTLGMGVPVGYALTGSVSASSFSSFLGAVLVLFLGAVFILTVAGWIIAGSLKKLLGTDTKDQRLRGSEKSARNHVQLLQIVGGWFLTLGMGVAVGYSLTGSVSATSFVGSWMILFLGAVFIMTIAGWVIAVLVKKLLGKDIKDQRL